MKNFKIIIAVISAFAVLLASFGALAAGTLDVSGDIFTGKVTVTASFDKCKNEPVSVQIVPLETDIDDMEDISYGLSETVYLNQKKSNSNGVAVFEIPLKVESGKYIVRVHSMTNPDLAYEKLLKYVSFEDMKNAWDNLSASPKDCLKIILDADNCTDELILSLKDDETLFEYISEYENIGELNRDNLDKLLSRIKTDCESIITFRNALNVIKEAENVSGIKSILKDEENVKALGIDDLISRYNKLKNTRSVDKALMGETFDSPADFRKAFLDALKDAENADDNKKGGSTSQGKGSSSLGTSINVAPVPVAPVVNALPFKDVDSVLWAKDAIADLYSKGIINGKSDSTFAPDDHILREEFVKMAVSFLGLEVTNANTAFSDVDSGAWYAPYISAAVKAGIINGYSESIFGVGNYITRQDVAVILSRIAKLQGSSEIAFADEADISDYAKEAVQVLSANGIINGSDGAFMPKNNCTRAETAVMIHRLSKIMKEGV